MANKKTVALTRDQVAEIISMTTLGSDPNVAVPIFY